MSNDDGLTDFGRQFCADLSAAIDRFIEDARRDLEAEERAQRATRRLKEKRRAAAGKFSK
jgi:hypothetical protein